MRVAIWATFAGLDEGTAKQAMPPGPRRLYPDQALLENQASNPDQLPAPSPRPGRMSGKRLSSATDSLLARTAKASRTPRRCNANSISGSGLPEAKASGAERR